MSMQRALVAAAASAAFLASACTIWRSNRKRRAPLPRCKKVIIIGASGAIGKSLVTYFLDRGVRVVAPVHRTRLPAPIRTRTGLIEVVGFDCRSISALDTLCRDHADADAVWMLAAPLSVDTAKDPDLARDVVVGGMSRLLDAMSRHAIRQVCFSDSIGSFGSESPRRAVGASWLVQNPTQDPGSAYGRQKRECRALMKKFASSHPENDARWAVIPGVLHTDTAWGGGTTEYALEAVKAAAVSEKGGPSTYVCPIPLSTELPMIMRRDLIRGLYKLTVAPRARLREPENGYAISGFSFTAKKLVAKLRSLVGDRFKAVEAKDSLTSPAGRFAMLWPDSLSSVAAARDIGFKAELSFDAGIAEILNAWRMRLGDAKALVDGPAR